jgi:glycerate kinase
MNSLPPSIKQVIQKNENNRDAQTAIKNSQVFLIGNNRVAIDAAMSKAKSYNLVPVFLSAEVQGNVIDISNAFFKLACAIKQNSLHSSSRDKFIESFDRDVLHALHAQSNFLVDLIDACKCTSADGICIISGGETTVTVQGDGLGGRNQELALRFTKHCHDAGISCDDKFLFLSAGSDGIDGNNDAAGAIGGMEVLSNINKTIKVSDVMEEYIFGNDSYNFYKKFLSKYAGDRYHIHTGITGTNVMDIHLLLMIMPNARLS